MSAHPSSPLPWGVKRIGAHKLWKKTKGKGIRIAVIDTGVDYSHPDIKHALDNGINLVQRHLPPIDDNGHGTHIAGTIAANRSDGGLLGVAPLAKVHPVKAFDYNGTAYVTDIVEGLEWCIYHRMHIINMSFGMNQPSSLLYEAILKAYKQGIVIIASSGNDGRKGGIDFPANFKETIAVGASNYRRRAASFSNRSSEVDLYAPGQKVESTWLQSQYRKLSGSSMATAHVSGAIALMLSVYPHLNPEQIKRILADTSIPMNYNRVKRLKEINVYKSIRQLNTSRRRKKK